MGQKGLTLIELLVTITILAILASVVMPLAQMSVKRDKEVELKRNLRVIRTALDEFKRASDEGRVEKKAGESGYPPDLITLVEGVESMKVLGGDGSDEPPPVLKFLRRVPRDPMEPNMFLEPEDTWALRSYESDPDSPAEGDDVFDVYSRSQEIALDGTQYSNW